MRAPTALNLQQIKMRVILRLDLRGQLCAHFQRALKAQDLLVAPGSGPVNHRVCGHRYAKQHHLLLLHRPIRWISLGNPLRSPQVVRTN